MKEVALLVSGGVESCILAGLLSQVCRQVKPVYVKFGLTWEESELFHLKRYLQAIAHKGLAELIVLEMPVDDVYQNHWSQNGIDVPEAGTPDEAVYLPGRNILLTAKTAVWCALNNVQVIALGSLGTNPFPDATESFYESLESAYRKGLASQVEIIRPLFHMHKEEALRISAHLPLELSFSCIQPQLIAGNSGNNTSATTIHCGACNKCEERINAFKTAEVSDKTVYWEGATCIK